VKIKCNEFLSYNESSSVVQLFSVFDEIKQHVTYWHQMASQRIKSVIAANEKLDKFWDSVVSVKLYNEYTRAYANALYPLSQLMV
jgi:hypothetical protein